MYTAKIILYLLIVATALGCGSSAGRGGAAGATLVRYPYLQLALADSTTVFWRTDRGGRASVDYQERGGGGEWRRTVGLVRPTSTGLVENEVVLCNLRPETVYEYRIGGGHGV